MRYLQLLVIKKRLENYMRLSNVFSMVAAFCLSLSTYIFCGQALAQPKTQPIDQLAFDYTSIVNVNTGKRITVDDYIGGSISFLGLPKGVTTKLTYPDDANLIVADAKGTLFELPHGMSSGYIESIIIRSPTIKNADGIGVGTSVDTFLRTYPFSKLYYTKYNNKLWLSNGVVDTAFELADKPFINKLIKNLRITSDWMTIDKGRLPKAATIKTITISGRVFDYQSHLGQWESADKTVYLSLFETDNQPYYQLIIGERILNQYEGELIAVLGAFYSEPAGNKYHIVLSPGNGDTPDGIPEMTVTLTPHFSLPAKEYVLKKCKGKLCS